MLITPHQCSRVFYPVKVCPQHLPLNRISGAVPLGSQALRPLLVRFICLESGGLGSCILATLSRLATYALMHLLNGHEREAS